MNIFREKKHRGFSLIEIVTVVAIVAGLAVVAMLSLTAMRDRLLLDDARSALSFHLEESKARAVAGKGGESHGVYFASDRYVQFVGDEYEGDDDSNAEHPLDPGLTLTTDILDDEEVIIFSRITGTVGETVTLTISLNNDPTKTRVIMVGEGGDISYAE